MKNLIVWSDFLGFKPTLHIQKKPLYKSFFTGLLSCLVVLISLLCTGYFGSELLIKKSPTVITSKETADVFPSVKVSNKGFLFAIGLEYNNFSYYVDERVFSVNAFKQNITNYALPNGTVLQIVTTTPVKIDLCDKFYKQEDILETNLKVPLDLFYCAEPNATTIEGNWGAPTYINLRVEFKKCVNTTENNFKCKSKEEIDKTIQNGYLSMDFTTYNVDPKDYHNPLKRMWFNDYNLLNVRASIEYSINLLPLNFTSDNGLLFEDFQTSSGHYHDMRIFNRFEESDYICSFNFQGNTEATVFNRSYVKLQTVVTQIGGFIKAIMLIAYFLSTIFSQNHFFITYMKEVLELSNPKASENTHKNRPMFFNRLKSDSNLKENNNTNVDSNLKLYNNMTININKNNNRQINNNLNNLNFNSKKNDKNNVINNNQRELNPQEMKNDGVESLNKNKQIVNPMRMKQKKLTSINDTSTVKMMFDYLFNIVLFWKAQKAKSNNYTLVSAISRIYMENSSIEEIIKKKYEIAILNDVIIKSGEENLDFDVKKMMEMDILTEENS